MTVGEAARTWLDCGDDKARLFDDAVQSWEELSERDQELHEACDAIPSRATTSAAKVIREVVLKYVVFERVR